MPSSRLRAGLHQHGRPVVQGSLAKKSSDSLLAGVRHRAKMSQDNVPSRTRCRERRRLPRAPFPVYNDPSLTT